MSSVPVISGIPARPNVGVANRKQFYCWGIVSRERYEETRYQNRIRRTDGVDRAALDVELELGLRCGGWCPTKGRLALDGPLDERYPLKDTESADYSVRTRLNVRDADATLILNCGELSGGTAYTLRVAEELGRPAQDMDHGGNVAQLARGSRGSCAQCCRSPGKQVSRHLQRGEMFSGSVAGRRLNGSH